MYGKPFDHKKPFGTIHGISVAAYEQDGQLYNGQKQPIDADGNLMKMAPQAVEDEDLLPKAADNPQPPAENADDDVPEDEKPFDILAWAQGDETLKATPWAKVKAEAAVLLGDTAPLPSKEAARKAVLAHYGLQQS